MRVAGPSGTTCASACHSHEWGYKHQHPQLVRVKLHTCSPAQHSCHLVANRPLPTSESQSTGWGLLLQIRVMTTLIGPIERMF